MIRRVRKEFPVYKAAVRAGHIVKFTGTKVGQVVKAGITRDVGYSSSSWVHYQDTVVWRTLTDSEVCEVGGVRDFESCCRLKE
jgi:hypothetical protein